MVTCKAAALAVYVGLNQQQQAQGVVLDSTVASFQTQRPLNPIPAGLPLFHHKRIIMKATHHAAVTSSCIIRTLPKQLCCTTDLSTGRKAQVK
jgi:hypothetical protein